LTDFNTAVCANTCTTVWRIFKGQGHLKVKKIHLKVKVNIQITRPKHKTCNLYVHNRTTEKKL